MKLPLLLLTLFMGPQDTTATPTDNIPDLYEGRWIGTVYQDGWEPYIVRLNIWEAEYGDKAGVVEYSDQGCGGNLYLRKSTADEGVSGSVLLDEDITYDASGVCIDNGQFTIFFDEENQCVAFYWQHDYYTITAYAQLYKGD